MKNLRRHYGEDTDLLKKFHFLKKNTPLHDHLRLRIHLLVNAPPQIHTFRNIDPMTSKGPFPACPMNSLPISHAMGY
jgi:hypothetical protein